MRSSGVLDKREKTFTNTSRKTSIIKHMVDLVDNRPIRCKPNALPYSVRGEIQKEIQEMINIEIVRESDSPYASPMVVIKKRIDVIVFVLNTVN